ncbi:MAG: diacylglycerol kinase family lipid kinase [Bacteroidales bacterium]|jgi:YegS/Rv2252/BmrU family lipid kinase|nr:diacylglycerol kinase family lipid kinase [Bacteroidales bacterium]
MNRTGFIINPIAGTGKYRSIEKHIRQVFPTADIYITSQTGEAQVIAAKLVKQQYDCIVAVGGDGTVNEVACPLVGSSTALGILPTGSGNGLARHLHIPLEPAAALHHLISSKPRSIDVGIIAANASARNTTKDEPQNGKMFFCTAGVGFDAQVSVRFEKQRKRGFLSYLRCIIKEYVHYKSQKYTITTEKKSIETTAFLITFANASQWGNNAYIAPQANIEDGYMDAVIIPRVSFPRLLIMAVRLLRKKIHHDPLVTTLRFNSLTLSRQYPAPVHIDGEPVTDDTIATERITVNVLKSALQVIR